MKRYLLISICAFFFVSCFWFCLWSIAYYFTLDPNLAIIFFPFALRLGLSLHTPKIYWPGIYGAEWLLIGLISEQFHLPETLGLLIASTLSLPVTYLAQRYYCNPQWRRLLVIAVLLLSFALINNVLLFFNPLHSVAIVALVSISGGIMLVPSCYLIWSYLFDRPWIPLAANVIHYPMQFRFRHVIRYCALFVISVVLQLGLPDELRLFAPFCLAIPIIVLAFQYGWHGALMGTLLNSVALIAARSNASEMQVVDLLLSLLAQSLTGILLGLGIQRQRELNSELRLQIRCNQQLTNKLLYTEESVRKEVARELHDEIGQTITAIRTQAIILKRMDSSELVIRCANMIENLSLNIYDTTKKLLTKLRPHVLDHFGLIHAIEQLAVDLALNQRGIQLRLNLHADSDNLSDALGVTIYRICQESLNNLIKYAKASEVAITLTCDSQLELIIRDNGIGFLSKEPAEGFGLKGMSERVHALGGQLTIDSQPQQGTCIHVHLPLPEGALT